MKDLKQALLLMCAVVLFGGALSACETIGPMFGSYQNKIESIIGVAVAGKYNVTISKDGKALVTETWECTTDGLRLTGCHRVSSQTVSTDVVAPKVP